MARRLHMNPDALQTALGPDGNLPMNDLAALFLALKGLIFSPPDRHQDGP